VNATAPLAIFDLDGTLTTQDTFVAYLVSFGRRHRKIGALVAMPFRVSGYLLKLLRDHQLKQQLLRSFFGGAGRAQIEEHTDWFCRNWLPRHLHSVGNRFLKEHLAQNHRVILLSASPDLYVPAVGRALGIAETLCTQVAFEGDLCAGRLVGSNCKGDEKIARVREYLGVSAAPPNTSAYGDSRHDLPLLNWVENGVLVKARTSQVVERTNPAFPQSTRVNS
jgi:HAD superfamily hydrolase (TIGR01490 family)